MAYGVAGALSAALRQLPVDDMFCASNRESFKLMRLSQISKCSFTTLHSSMAYSNGTGYPLHIGSTILGTSETLFRGLTSGRRPVMYTSAKDAVRPKKENIPILMTVQQYDVGTCTAQIQM